MPKEKKKRAKDRSSKSKIIKSRESGITDYDSYKILFSLEYIGIRNYDLKACGDKEKALFLEAMYKRSGKTWLDIKRDSYQSGIGYEMFKDPKLNDRLTKKTKPNLSEDIKMICFRASNMMRMIGFSR